MAYAEATLIFIPSQILKKKFVGAGLTRYYMLVVLLSFLEEIRTVTMGQQPMHIPYPNYNLLLQIFCWRSKNAALLGGRDENRIT